jgi:hypothetical protein
MENKLIIKAGIRAKNRKIELTPKWNNNKLTTTICCAFKKQATLDPPRQVSSDNKRKTFIDLDSYMILLIIQGRLK